MAKESIQTMVYLHPEIRAWVEASARFNSDTMTGVIRRLIRDHIREVDPLGWSRIESVLRADAAAADGSNDSSNGGGGTNAIGG